MRGIINAKMVLANCIPRLDNTNDIVIYIVP